MGIGGKASGTTTIADEDTGDVAKVEAKTTGEKALHVIAEMGTTSGASLKNFFVEVTLGNVPGYSSVSKFGENIGVSNSTPETIWDGSNMYPWPSTAATVDVKSSDANDTSAGTGARTVLLQGLDAGFLEIEETITTNGVSNVTSVNSYLRLHRMKVLTAGSSAINEGDITASQGATLIAQITEERGQTLMALYTIPAGKSAAMLSYYWNVPKSQDATIRLFSRTDGEAFQVKNSQVGAIDHAQQLFTTTIYFPEKTDVEVRAEAGNNNINVSAGFELILMDNP